MKLSDVLVALSCNKKLLISLMEGKKSVEVFAAVDYKKVTDKYGDEVVKKIKITSPTTMAISLDDGEEEVEEPTEEE